MKVLASCLLGSLLFLANQVYAEQTINLSTCRGLTVEDFNAVAKWALTKGHYQIEKDTGDTLTGVQKQLEPRRLIRDMFRRMGEKENMQLIGNIVVEIAMTGPDEIVVRWKPGSEAQDENSLRNLKANILWRLAE